MIGEERKPATAEQISSLMETMKRTIESLYKELFMDNGFMAAIERGLLKELPDEEVEYLDKVVRLHANICYAHLCMCVQIRASLPTTIGVEKQYITRRGVVTDHEMYKYLYGFNGKSTPWMKVEQVLRQKYPTECAAISSAAAAYRDNYAQDADGTLRDVAKHFSSNPREFFTNMEDVNERNVTDRTAAAMAFLQPIHTLLTTELKEKLGKAYDLALLTPMPQQTFEPVGLQQDKIDALEKGVMKYGGIVNSVMRMVKTVEEKSGELHLNLTQSNHWNDITEDNIGLHILYIDLDLMITFRAITRSEMFAEFSQNLAYMIVSAHEGFKKLYGFDAAKRGQSFWCRAIKDEVLQSRDSQLCQEAEDLEKRLEVLANSDILKDEDRVVAFTHVGTIKKLQRESSLAVLDYFIKPVCKKDLDDLTAFLWVMNDIVRLYNKVMTISSTKIKKETSVALGGIKDMWEKCERVMMDNLKDPKQIDKWKETSDKMKDLLKKLGGEID